MTEFSEVHQEGFIADLSSPFKVHTPWAASGAPPRGPSACPPPALCVISCHRPCATGGTRMGQNSNTIVDTMPNGMNVRGEQEGRVSKRRWVMPMPFTLLAVL